MKGKKTGGRVKGVPNKINRDIREMVYGALHDAGGRAYLAQRAIDSPQAFLALLGRIHPKDVTLSGGSSPVVLQVVTGVPDAGSGS